LKHVYPLLLVVLILLAAVGISCHGRAVTVAVIPRTTATPFWESFHIGVAEIARQDGIHYYWNAPSNEADVEKQLVLFSRCSSRSYAGFILAPDSTLAFRSAVGDIVNKRVPVVIVNAKLGPPPGPFLSYVLNDEEFGAKLAADRVIGILKGHGNIAIIGISTDGETSPSRDIFLEKELSLKAPGIHVVDRRFDDAVVAHQQSIAQEIIATPGHVDAIVALSSIATRGAYYAKIIERRNSLLIVGFDQELQLPVQAGAIDSVVVQDTRKIGNIAMQNLAKQIHGDKVEGYSMVPPILHTKEQLANSTGAVLDDSYDWSKQ
jgi:ribose transport system substrate-binding protein